MAEAVRPKTKYKTKQKATTMTHDDDDPVVGEELSLEDRLKSLTSFVNSLVDASDGVVVGEMDEVAVEPQTAAQNDDYYAAISEKAAEQMPATFLDLNKRIELIRESQKIDDLTREQASAPIFDQTRVEDAASAPFAQDADYDLINRTSIQQVVDFNADKIENLQTQFLNYPKLKYFPTDAALADVDMKLSEEYEAKLARFIETNDYYRELDNYFYPQSIENAEVFANDFVDRRQQSDFGLFYGKHEFFELLKDFYESRLIVDNCLKHMTLLKNQIYEYATYRVWSFAKYKCESNAYCGDNQRIKHVIDCEKALLNKEAVDKLKTLLKDIRCNIKTILISSKFCSKLTVLKIEAYLYEQFVLKATGNSDK
jgi:hypothetical protein